MRRAEAPSALRRAGEGRELREPIDHLCTPLGYARSISIDSVKNVVYTDADIDEILAELNASVRGRTHSALISSKPNLDIAHLIAGAGMTSVRLACRAEHGGSIELTLVDGPGKRARNQDSR